MGMIERLNERKMYGKDKTKGNKPDLLIQPLLILHPLKGEFHFSAKLRALGLDLGRKTLTDTIFLTLKTRKR